MEKENEELRIAEVVEMYYSESKGDVIIHHGWLFDSIQTANNFIKYLEKSKRHLAKGHNWELMHSAICDQKQIDEWNQELKIKNN